MKKTKENGADLLEVLRERFESNMGRHKGMRWDDVLARLKKAPAALAALKRMEETGGEPDVTGTDKASGAIIFTDCAPESPAGRRSVCYDGEALRSRKEHKPRTSAVEMAEEMGIGLLDERQYRALQEIGEFDRKTSSWIHTPADIRALGGALFCDRRFGHVFTYHNGAESYYAARGFRGRLLV